MINKDVTVEEHVDYKREFIAALSTYLTMSYIFILNPALLAKVGINESAAFFATIVTAFASTIAMGLFAKLPYAVAPVPTVTAFFCFLCMPKNGASLPGGVSSCIYIWIN